MVMGNPLDSSKLSERITPALVENAWKAVNRNCSGAGATPPLLDFYAEKLQERLDLLRHKILERDYRSITFKEGENLPEELAENQKLWDSQGVDFVNCLIVQEIVRRLIYPIFDRHFADDPRDWHKRVRQSLETALRVEIPGLFVKVPHDLILRLIKAEIQDSLIVSLIDSLMEAGIMNKEVIHLARLGDAQGGVLSALLVNIVLNHLKKKLVDQGFQFFRPFPDAFIICRLPTGKQAQPLIASTADGEPVAAKISDSDVKVLFRQVDDFEKWLSQHKKRMSKEEEEELLGITKEEQEKGMDIALDALNDVFEDLSE